MSDATDRKLGEVPELLWELNLDGGITFCSPNVKNVLGYEPGETLGKSPAEFIPSQDSSRFSSVLESARADERVSSIFQQSFRLKKGGLTLLESELKPVHNEAGTLVGFQYVSKDVSSGHPDQKQAKAPGEGSAAAEKNSEEILRQIVPHIIPWG